MAPSFKSALAQNLRVLSANLDRAFVAVEPWGAQDIPSEKTKIIGLELDVGLYMVSKNCGSFYIYGFQKKGDQKWGHLVSTWR